MIFLAVYLVISLVSLLAAIFYALYVRDVVDRYPGIYGPDVDAKKLAESALLVFLAPAWPVAALVAVARAIWSLVQDVLAYYFKSNRKEGDDR